MAVLVCAPIHKDGIERLKRAGFTVDVKPTISNEELKRLVSTYDVLVVRSRIAVTAEVIDRGRRLKVIGRPGVGKRGTLRRIAGGIAESERGFRVSG